MSGYFMQSMLSNRSYSSFVSMDDWRSYPKLSLNFLPDRVEIQASTNQGILLCRTIHPRYYVCKPTTQQWQKIPNPKTRYHTLATGMIVIGSNPLHYKIVRFSQPRFRCHDKEFYRYYRVRCELFDSKTWMWRQLDEVKLPNHGSFSRKPAVSVSGSLHWLTYVENNIFAFHVNKESYSMFSIPLSDSEDDKGKDIELVEYMGKLAITCIGKDKSYMELWVMKNYGEIEWNKRYKINIEAFRKEPYTRPVAFYNADIVLMKELDHRVTFFNFKNGSTDRLSLENELNHGCFRFQSDFEPSDLTGGFALKHPQVFTYRNCWMKIWDIFWYEVLTLRQKRPAFPTLKIVTSCMFQKPVRTNIEALADSMYEKPALLYHLWCHDPMIKREGYKEEEGMGKYGIGCVLSFPSQNSLTLHHNQQAPPSLSFTMVLSSLLSKPCISLLTSKPFPDNKNNKLSPTSFTLYSSLKTNGIALHKSGLIPFAATFLVFSDYMKNSILLSALSHAGVIYIMTHDSIGPGEDGPTHQPVEQLAGLRAVPRLLVFRPADGNETAGAYRVAIEDRDAPRIIALSRQKVAANLEGTSAYEVEKGGYIISDNSGKSLPDIILISTGSEPCLCEESPKMLRKEGRKVRLVSLVF
ncbi:hypothetical protein DKX38_016496 [Salix brachista]|uniref:Transketolase-like pyrimidine-binding domain-containing protein n=1 Tax=Salix brachista TaxID=2182728 RepID=A0A5N5L840_9ROSI|nr:hypothetical protein DKX38_016496 [Salix brachista]